MYILELKDQKWNKRIGIRENIQPSGFVLLITNLRKSFVPTITFLFLRIREGQKNWNKHCRIIEAKRRTLNEGFIMHVFFSYFRYITWYHDTSEAGNVLSFFFYLSANKRFRSKDCNVYRDTYQIKRIRTYE